MLLRSIWKVWKQLVKIVVFIIGKDAKRDVNVNNYGNISISTIYNIIIIQLRKKKL